jgi:hypothetical protein
MPSINIEHAERQTDAIQEFSMYHLTSHSNSLWIGTAYRGNADSTDCASVRDATPTFAAAKRTSLRSQRQAIT